MDGRPAVDERVAIALRNWLPRFVIRGVDYGDVVRLAESIRTWEDVYLARGMATLSLDGPGQGEGGYGEGRMRPDYEAAVTAALDHLAGRDDLDMGRVGAIGISLGGHYAPRAAAGEPRLRAVVAV